jgi:hypothetical protein
MRALLAIAYSLLALIGCDPLPGSRISSRSEVDGVTVLHSVVTRSTTGMETFACRTSDSGRCHYVVFVERCAPARIGASGSAVDACTPRVLSTFAVPAGQAQDVAGLGPDFKLCVSNDLTPDAKTCADT